eukprot:310802_1
MDTDDKESLLFQRIFKISKFFNEKTNTLSCKLLKGSSSMAGKGCMESSDFSVAFSVSITDYEKATVEFYKSSNHLRPSLEIESLRLEELCESSKEKYQIKIKAEQNKLSLAMYRKTDPDSRFWLSELQGRLSTKKDESYLTFGSDLFKDNTLLVGAHAQFTNNNGWSIYKCACTTPSNDIFMFSAEIPNTFTVGFMKSKLFNQFQNSFFGNIEYTIRNQEIEGSFGVGMRRDVNEDMCIDAFVSSHKYGFVGLNYSKFFNEYNTSKVEFSIG